MSSEEKQGRQHMQIRFCHTCGRDDRISRFGDRHYSHGELCSGVPITLTLTRDELAQQKIAEVRERQDKRRRKPVQQYQFMSAGALLDEIDTLLSFFSGSGEQRQPRRCVRCGHRDGTGTADGRCAFLNSKDEPCLCKCLFEATGAEADPVQLKDPEFAAAYKEVSADSCRINALLDALMRVRDMAVDLGGARGIADAAVKEYYRTTGSDSGEQELKAIERLHLCPKCDAACLCRSARDAENANCQHCADSGGAGIKCLKRSR